jgi:hypothetical protein
MTPTHLVLSWEPNGVGLLTTASCSSCRLPVSEFVPWAAMPKASEALGVLVATAERSLRGTCPHTFDHVRDDVVIGTLARVNGEIGELMLLVARINTEVHVSAYLPPSNVALAFVCTCHIDRLRCVLHRTPKSIM